MAGYGSAHVRLLAKAREHPDGFEPDADDGFHRDGLFDLRSVGCLDHDGRLTEFGRAELARIEAGGERIVTAPENTPPKKEGSAMAEQIDGTAAPEAIATKLQQATNELEDMLAANQQLQQQFESHEWSGLDALAQTRVELDQARDSLGEVARKVGLGAQVAEAYQVNSMAGDKESLGRT